MKQRRRTTPKLNPAEAKSICKCEHVGDGPHSEHAGILGHGSCFECGCRKFTWDRFLTVDEQSAYLAGLEVKNE